MAFKKPQTLKSPYFVSYDLLITGRLRRRYLKHHLNICLCFVVPLQNPFNFILTTPRVRLYDSNLSQRKPKAKGEKSLNSKCLSRYRFCFTFTTQNWFHFVDLFFGLSKEFYRISIVTISGASGTPHVVNVGFHCSQEKHSLGRMGRNQRICIVDQTSS